MPPTPEPARRRALLLGSLSALVLGVCAVAHADGPIAGLTLHPRHHVGRSRAVLSPAILAEIDAVARPASVDVAWLNAQSLALTGRWLHFGMSHRTSLRFDTADREGHCVEYAHLYSAVFERLAGRANVRATARVVHSDEARLAGMRVPMRGWHDHDWALIEGEGHRWYVDPSLADAGLGWNLEQQVYGSVDP